MERIYIPSIFYDAFLLTKTFFFLTLLLFESACVRACVRVGVHACACVRMGGVGGGEREGGRIGYLPGIPCVCRAVFGLFATRVERQHGVNASPGMASARRRSNIHGSLCQHLQGGREEGRGGGCYI